MAYAGPARGKRVSIASGACPCGITLQDGLLHYGERFAVTRTLSGNADRTRVELVGAPAPLSAVFFFDVLLPSAIRYPGHKSVFHIDETPQGAAPAAIGQAQSPAPIQK